MNHYRLLFGPHPQIDSVFPKPGSRYELSEEAMVVLYPQLWVLFRCSEGMLQYSQQGKYWYEYGFSLLAIDAREARQINVYRPLIGKYCHTKVRRYFLNGL